MKFTFLSFLLSLLGQRAGLATPAAIDGLAFAKWANLALNNGPVQQTISPPAAVGRWISCQSVGKESCILSV